MARPTITPGTRFRIREGAIDPVQEAVVEGAEIEAEGYWQDISGNSCHDFPPRTIAEAHYQYRASVNKVPKDDDVVYGKIDRLGHLVHVTELVSMDGSPVVTGRKRSPRSAS